MVIPTTAHHSSQSSPRLIIPPSLWASSTANALNLCRSNGARTTIFPTFSIYRRFSSVLDGFKYNFSHKWVKNEGSVATIGFTDHAQGHLGEVVFVELPEFGQPSSTQQTNDDKCGIGFYSVSIPNCSTGKHRLYGRGHPQPRPSSMLPPLRVSISVVLDTASYTITMVDGRLNRCKCNVIGLSCSMTCSGSRARFKRYVHLRLLGSTYIEKEDIQIDYKGLL